ncbi:MAG: filamentous hemagglutinin N-terminal domain-containing protein, partial [Negativicutes bacterium]
MKQTRKIRRNWLREIPQWMRCFCRSVMKAAKSQSRKAAKAVRAVGEKCSALARSVNSELRTHNAKFCAALKSHTKEWAAAALTAGLIAAPFTVDISPATLHSEFRTQNCLAAPEGGVVVGGNAQISAAGNVTTISQTSARAAIDWTSFNVAARETVNFQQPNASSVALNRIVGNNPSAIYGQLNANGIIYLANPNGMYFAPGAQVNVAGLIATTSHVDPLAFMQTGLISTGERNAAINIQGSIFASGGLVEIKGATAINNSGLIQAKGINNVGGRIVLGGAQIVANDGTLDSGAGGMIDISARSNVADEYGVASINGTLAAAAGAVTIDADLAGLGGVIKLNADNGGSLQVSASTIMQTNKADIQANGTANGGNISYWADEMVLMSGSVQANGVQGGQVEVLGGSIDLQAAAISAAGNNNGGQINIGGDWQGNGERRHATDTYVNSTTVLDVSSALGQGGTAVIWSDNNTGYFGTIKAFGAAGQGGAVEVSGLGDLLYAGEVNAGSGGKLLLDPKNITVDDIITPFSNTPLVIDQTNVAGGMLSTNFGTSLITTTTGDYLIGDGGYSVGGVAGGAIFLFDKTSGALKATLTGSHDDDRINSNNCTILRNNNVVTGNYVFTNTNWDSSKGAVSFVNPAVVSGVTVVSAANSLIGTTAGDNVGNNGTTVLNSGNYIVRSGNWDNGSATDAGAVTWGSGTTGVSGEVSAANSLVGSHANDYIGNSGITMLNSGNYIVRSGNWDNGSATDAGAVTWGSGTAGVTGEVSAANSLVGSHAGDQVGNNGI